MRCCAKLATRWLVPSMAGVLLAAPLHAQESVLVVCAEQSRCTYQRVYSVTLQGKDSVKAAPIAMANDVQALRKARSVHLNSVAALYHEPQSGLVRIVSSGWQLGEVIVPSKWPDNAITAATAIAGAAFEYQMDARTKSRLSVPVEQFIALLIGPRPEASAVDFIRREVQAEGSHPLRKELVSGALAFAAASPELKAWREDLRGTMRRSLDLFRSGEGVDPARLEATLLEGLAAMRSYSQVALEGQEERTLQGELTAEHRRLLDRFAIAGAFKNARMHDAFLEEVDQIGLARWARQELASGTGPSLRGSSEAHLQRATELMAAKQYGLAFDEALLANSRATCDENVNNFYYRARVEFVNRNMIPIAPEYDGDNRSMLQQIVRDIQGIGPETALTPERVEYVRKRIRDGEALDKDYLPLQLRKAEFLANLGELMASRDVVTRVERTVPLGRNVAEEWLQLDAKLTRELVAIRQKSEKDVNDLLGREQFKEALQAAATGLRADPANRRLLYHSAVAAAIMRNREAARGFVERYLRAPGLDCASTPEVENTVFDVYRRSAAVTARAGETGGKVPNWMSGELYAPGEAFYDPLSGSFQPHMSVSAVDKGPRMGSTEFRWDGFMAGSITTTVSSRPGEPVSRERTLLTIEPEYDQKHIYMSGIGAKANSAGERHVLPLRYLNSPDFDPLLAAKFSKKVSTRGWAGNPFFHPFLWNDIFLFELEYDDLGRIKTATPMTQDISRPSSPFSEPLTFKWEGASKRLLAISGTKYRREMTYDNRGRLTAEKITHPSGDGRIEYQYRGDSMQLVLVTCEDNFYDKSHRTISFDARDR